MEPAIRPLRSWSQGGRDPSRRRRRLPGRGRGERACQVIVEIEGGEHQDASRQRLGGENLIDQTNLGSTAQRLHQAAQHPGRLFAAAALLLIASALLIPTLIHALRLVRTRGRGTGLAKASAALLTIGALGHGALVGLYAVISAAATHQSPQAIAVDRADATAVGSLVGVGIMCFELGFVLLLIALVRSRIASRWLPLAIPAARPARRKNEK